MNAQQNSNFLLLGLSGSGKTNYLVALDLILDNQSDKDGLVHLELANDRTYLQPLREQWLRGEELQHTSRQQQPPPHQLIVKHPASGAIVDFYLPDLAGETFDSHFATRSFPVDFRERLIQANGLLLFVHSDDNAGHEVFQEGYFEEAPSSSGGVPTTESKQTWQIESAEKQVKLVDLLQFVAEVRPVGKPLPISVIISAWDLIDSLAKDEASLLPEIPRDPALFFEKKWPLLHQFLCSNPEHFNFRAFGISARGGNNTPAENKRLTALSVPSNRLLVVDGAHRSTDLTRPVRWLLGLLKS